jgi:hypothetical protein
VELYPLLSRRFSAEDFSRFVLYTVNLAIFLLEDFSLPSFPLLFNPFSSNCLLFLQPPAIHPSRHQASNQECLASASSFLHCKIELKPYYAFDF